MPPATNTLQQTIQQNNETSAYAEQNSRLVAGLLPANKVRDINERLLAKILNVAQGDDTKSKMLKAMLVKNDNESGTASFSLPSGDKLAKMLPIIISVFMEKKDDAGLAFSLWKVAENDGKMLTPNPTTGQYEEANLGLTTQSEKDGLRSSAFKLADEIISEQSNEFTEKTASGMGRLLHRLGTGWDTIQNTAELSADPNIKNASRLEIGVRGMFATAKDIGDFFKAPGPDMALIEKVAGAAIDLSKAVDEGIKLEQEAIAQTGTDSVSDFFGADGQKAMDELILAGKRVKTGYKAPIEALPNAKVRATKEEMESDQVQLDNLIAGKKYLDSVGKDTKANDVAIAQMQRIIELKRLGKDPNADHKEVITAPFMNAYNTKQRAEGKVAFNSVDKAQRDINIARIRQDDDNRQRANREYLSSVNIKNTPIKEGELSAYDTMREHGIDVDGTEFQAKLRSYKQNKTQLLSFLSEEKKKAFAGETRIALQGREELLRRANVNSESIAGAMVSLDDAIGREMYAGYSNDKDTILHSNDPVAIREANLRIIRSKRDFDILKEADQKMMTFRQSTGNEREDARAWFESKAKEEGMPSEMKSMLKTVQASSRVNAFNNKYKYVDRPKIGGFGTEKVLIDIETGMRVPNRQAIKLLNQMETIESIHENLGKSPVGSSAVDVEHPEWQDLKAKLTGASNQYAGANTNSAYRKLVQNRFDMVDAMGNEAAIRSRLQRIQAYTQEGSEDRNTAFQNMVDEYSKKTGKASQDVQEVLTQWFNTPGTSSTQSVLPNGQPRPVPAQYQASGQEVPPPIDEQYVRSKLLER